MFPPVLKNMKTGNDTIEDFIKEYGYLGQPLHAAVLQERQIPVSVATLPPTAITTASVSCVFFFFFLLINGLVTYLSLCGITHWATMIFWCFAGIILLGNSLA